MFIYRVCLGFSLLSISLRLSRMTSSHLSCNSYCNSLLTRITKQSNDLDVWFLVATKKISVTTQLHKSLVTEKISVTTQLHESSPPTPRCSCLGRHGGTLEAAAGIPPNPSSPSPPLSRADDAVAVGVLTTEGFEGVLAVEAQVDGLVPAAGGRGRSCVEARRGGGSRARSPVSLPRPCSSWWLELDPPRIWLRESHAAVSSWREGGGWWR
jgi:hypothetical protein